MRITVPYKNSIHRDIREILTVAIRKKYRFTYVVLTRKQRCCGRINISVHRKQTTIVLSFISLAYSYRHSRQIQRISLVIRACPIFEHICMLRVESIFLGSYLSHNNKKITQSNIIFFLHYGIGQMLNANLRSLYGCALYLSTAFLMLCHIHIS